VTAEDKISRLQQSVDELVGEIQRLPADVLYREPAPGEWPVMSTLAHVAELLPYWAHQAELVAREPSAPFGRTHEDAGRLGAIEQHGQDSLDSMVPRIRASLEECVATLRQLPTNSWATVGTSPSRGAMSVEQIVDQFLCNHAAEHAVQIRATLQTLQAAPR
jgi:uncharacterized damage-inducible protein DinB